MFKRTSLALTPLALLAFTGSVWAAQPKSYQVTGPVVSMTDSSITVKKGKDNWEIGRDASTKVTGELKEGAKVTVQYRMTATDVEVKGAPAEKTTKSKKK